MTNTTTTYRAYVRLLSIFWRSRFTEENQQLLCDMRDDIAKHWRLSPQKVQERAEDEALALRQREMHSDLPQTPAV